MSRKENAGVRADEERGQADDARVRIDVLKGKSIVNKFTDIKSFSTIINFDIDYSLMNCIRCLSKSK